MGEGGAGLWGSGPGTGTGQWGQTGPRSGPAWGPLLGWGCRDLVWPSPCAAVHSVLGMLGELSPGLRDRGAKCLGLSEPVSSCVMWGHLSCQYCPFMGSVLVALSTGPSMALKLPLGE